MTAADHPLAQDYLQRLDAASAVLPDERRAVLRAEVEEHLNEARAETDGSDRALGRVLDTLGPPERLVTEASGYAGPAPAPSDPGEAGAGAPARPRLEMLTLGLLVASILCCVSLVLLPVAPLPWLIGSVLVLFSARWSAGEKALALLAYGILGAPFLIVTVTGLGGVGWSESCSEGSDSVGSTWQTCSGDGGGPSSPQVCWRCWPCGWAPGSASCARCAARRTTAVFCGWGDRLAHTRERRTPKGGPGVSRDRPSWCCAGVTRWAQEPARLRTPCRPCRRHRAWPVRTSPACRR